ncbi:tetratricopeptide repeat protein, partial [Planctomycetota bacterium]
PADEQLLISRARVMVKLESPQIAIPELKAYCQTEEGSGSVAALVTLADLYRLSGDMDQAKLRIEQAEKVDPNSQTAIHARFIWLVAQKRYEELEEISSAYISAKEQNLTTVLRAASVLTALDSMTFKKEGACGYTVTNIERCTPGYGFHSLPDRKCRTCRECLSGITKAVPE